MARRRWGQEGNGRKSGGGGRTKARGIRRRDPPSTGPGALPLAIILGFSILVTSNFIPTIYFGLLTVVVMFVALLCALLLLPILIIRFKPLSNKNKNNF